ncbi:MAG: hypothetical protein K6F57_03490 [Candidatus Saccharibacteria bacterium]|nr:hypothetical protein [Candidatus Saccharibacteria bacterium]
MRKYGFVVFIIIAVALFSLLVFIDAHKASLPEMFKPRESQDESSEQQTDLVALAKENGFSSIAGSNNGETSLQFDKEGYVVELVVFAENPKTLTVYPKGMTGEISERKSYQGHGSDHQFSDQAIICKWNDMWIYLAPEEYEDFLTALKGGV